MKGMNLPHSSRPIRPVAAERSLPHVAPFLPLRVAPSSVVVKLKLKNPRPPSFLVFVFVCLPPWWLLALVPPPHS